MRRQSDGITRIWVVALLLVAVSAIPAARLAPHFAVLFWAGATLLAIVALIIAARSRLRLPKDRSPKQ